MKTARERIEELAPQEGNTDMLIAAIIDYLEELRQRVEALEARGRLVE